MKIIILGAGQVGGTMAENLASEANDITVVDTNQVLLQALQDRLDIQIIVGNASHPAILRQAGAEDADLLVAVTNSDEINMIACQVAYTLFRTPTKISRIRSTAFLDEKGLFGNSAVPVDVIISPEVVVTEHISRLIEYPGALQVLDFSADLVRLVGIRATRGGQLVGHEIAHLRQHLPNVDTRVAAVYRRGSPIIPEGHTVIEEGDEVFFIAARNHIRTVMSELQPLERRYKRIMIAGGGNIGFRLASSLERHYNVKLIEQSKARCIELSQQLNSTRVLLGNAAYKNLLLEENIEDVDVFCAVTNDEKANIMAAMLAKRLGVRKVMALINNQDYVDLIQGGEIDIAISPQQTTISGLLSHVRRGEVVSAHSLRRGAAEAIEAVARGDHRSSKVVGQRLDEIKLPKDTTIGAIVRMGEVLIAHDHLRVQPDDHLILFVVDKKRVPEVEQLFQVGLTFF